MSGVVGAPNPNPRVVAIQLQGDVDDVVIRCYSKGMACLWQSRSGPREMGWTSVELDSNLLAGMGSGLYYITATPLRDETRGATMAGKILILR